MAETLLENVPGGEVAAAPLALPPLARPPCRRFALHRKWAPGNLRATPMKGATTRLLTGESGNVNTMDPEATSLEAAATTTLAAAPARATARATAHAPGPADVQALALQQAFHQGPSPAGNAPATASPTTQLAAEDQGLLERILARFKSKGRTHEWVVGTTDQAAWRLFTEHRANRKADAWVYDRASSPAAASAIAAHLAGLGARPFVGNGTEVYAYHLAEGAEA